MGAGCNLYPAQEHWELGGLCEFLPLIISGLGEEAAILSWSLIVSRSKHPWQT